MREREMQVILFKELKRKTSRKICPKILYGNIKDIE
jgi:hypothetical protein